MEPVALRPLTFGEVLDTSFNLFKRNFKSAVTVSAVIMVPLTLLAAAASAGLAPSDLAALEDPNASPEEVLRIFGSFFGALGAGALLQSLGSILVQAATTRIYSENYRGVKMNPGDALRYGVTRLPAMLGLTVLTTIGLFVGLIMCIAPGVWLYGVWGLAPAALIAESKGPVRSLGRSFELVQGTWWRVFGMLVVAQLLIGVIVGAVTAPIQIATGLGAGLADPEAAFTGSALAINTVVTGIATMVTLPFAAAVVVALYYDQRVRKEGYDLERLIADLGEAPQSALTEGSDPSDPFGLG